MDLSLTPLIILSIFIFAVGFFLGRITGARSAGSPRTLSELTTMRKAAREAVQSRIQKRKNRIMERAVQVGRIRNDDVEDLFCISDATARRYLNELEQEGKLTQQGTVGRGVYYTPT